MAHIEPRDEEGQTPVAWIAVTIMLFAFVVGTFGVVIGQIWVMWLGVGILILGGVVGKVMGMMGMGQYPRGKQEAAS